MENYEYRECEFETETYIGIAERKKELAELIDSNSKEKGKHYPKISKKKGKYYNDFSKLYKEKCAYCGVNTVINSTNLFEIDHYINKAQKVTDVDNIKNLIFACRKCNQAKKDFKITSDIQEYKLFHPDGEKLPTIFRRDDKYNILISDKYKNDNSVKCFHKKLKLGDYSRKLDFLLLRMHYLKEDNKLNSNLLRVYCSLLEIRNRIV